MCPGSTYNEGDGCPAGGCVECSGHGRCGGDGSCECAPPWHGDDCSRYGCDDSSCGAHGKCVPTGAGGGTRARARQGGTATTAAYASAMAIAATPAGATTGRAAAATAAPTIRAGAAARCRPTRLRSIARTSASADARPSVHAPSATRRCMQRRRRTQPPSHRRRGRRLRASWAATRIALRSACASVRRSSAAADRAAAAAAAAPTGLEAAAQRALVCECECGRWCRSTRVPPRATCPPARERRVWTLSP